MTAGAHETRAYYRGVLAALRFLDERQSTGRRFGQDADLRWSSFRGHLQDVDRIDVLVRDADAQWPGSLGARGVFDLRGVSEDDAFGEAWAPLDPVAGAELWRELSRSPAPPTLGLALSAIAAEWRLSLAPFAVPAIQPSARLVATGPSAVAALAEAFEGRADLDWADQVALVATDPGARQLAAFCGAALNVTRAPILVAAGTTPATDLRGRVLLQSDDAPAADRAWAARLASPPRA